MSTIWFIIHKIEYGDICNAIKLWKIFRVLLVAFFSVDLVSIRQNKERTVAQVAKINK